MVLAGTFRKEADRRGLAEGRREAALIGQITIGPELDGRPLSDGVSAAEKADRHENPANAAIVRSIVDLGHNLSMRVVAEGIETEPVLATLREYECDVATGLHPGAPDAGHQPPRLADRRREAIAPLSVLADDMNRESAQEGRHART